MNFRKYGSSLLLLLTAMIWGSSFVVQKTELHYMGPFTFNACRFTIDALCVLIFARVLLAQIPVQNLLKNKNRDVN